MHFVFTYHSLWKDPNAAAIVPADPGEAGAAAAADPDLPAGEAGEEDYGIPQGLTPTEIRRMEPVEVFRLFDTDNSGLISFPGT